MIKLYFKQAWNLLKANPLISSISVAGTAVSIAMIMVVVFIHQIQLAGYAPEYNRNRMLYVKGVEAKTDNSRYRGYMSSQVVKECFYSLESPEAVTAFADEARPVSLPAKNLYKSYFIKYTDSYFWQVFNFTFLSGKPFTEADFQSALPKAVVSEQLARNLYGKMDIVGETVVLDFVPYLVVGVVKNISEAASDARGDIWVPYTTNEDLMEASSNDEEITGSFQVSILARSKKDFEDIRSEIDHSIRKYNTMKSDYELFLPVQPIDRMEVAMGSTTIRKVSWKDFMFQTGGLLLFLILVPAINLTGVNQSSVQQRMGEMGLRKSFGATRNMLLWQVISENVVITFLGGGIGIALSFLFLYIGKSFLFMDNPALNMDMLFRPSAFSLALLFILLLNLLSALIPALRISRLPIVDSLK